MAVLARWVSPWSRFSDGVLPVVIPGAAQVSPVRKVSVQIASGAAEGATKTIDADTSSKAQAP
jgi:hypothetical protein